MHVDLFFFVERISKGVFLMFWTGFSKNPSFKIVMSGQQAPSQVNLLVNLFFKVICYLYSSVDCFHIW